MNFLEYVSFKNLSKTINDNNPDKIKIVEHAGGKHIGFGFTHKTFPLSINEQEFNFLRDIVILNNLKMGFELGTGIGISTLALGLAFEKNCGELITLDSYYEESTQISYNITDKDKFDINKVHEMPGYVFVKTLLKHFNLHNVVNQQIGWSPDDAIELLKNKTIDFVFLDCPKTILELERDFSYLPNYLSKSKFIIFIHDINDEIYRQEVSNMLLSKHNYKLEYYDDYYVNTPYHKKVHYPIHFINYNCNII